MTRSAAAVSAAGDITLVTPTQFLDTRTGGAVGSTLDPGEQVPLPAGMDLEVTAFAATSPGELFTGPCTGPDMTSAVVLFEVGKAQSNLLRVPVSGAPQCLVSSQPVAVHADQVANETGGATGSSFVSTAATLVYDALLSPGVGHPVSVATGAPSGLVGVSLDLRTDPHAPASAFVFGPCNGLTAISLTPGEPAAALAPVDGTGAVCVRLVGTASVHLRMTVTGYIVSGGAHGVLAIPTVRFVKTPVPAPGLEAVTPTRLFDTRDANAPVASGGTYRLDLASRVPTGATAVTMNVTATQADGPGYLTVYPCSDAQPTASNVNYTTGQTVPNLVTVGLGLDDTVCFFAATRTHVFADLAGFFVLGAGDGLVPTAPTRLFDTRKLSGPVASGQAFTMDLTPFVAADATAITMNVTATRATGPGYLTVYSCDAPRPTVSNLNYGSSETVPNLVTVKVGPDHKVCFFALTATDVIADLNGYYTPAAPAGFLDNTPQRLFDTRDAGETRLAAGSMKVFNLGPGITAATMNVTAVAPSGPGYVTVYPCEQGRPEASNINYVAGQVVPNLVTVQVGPSGQVCFYSVAATDLLADLAGVFTAQPVMIWVPTIVT